MVLPQIKLVFVGLLVILDCLTATLLFVHGNQWHLFSTSLRNFSFSTSFVDLCCFTYFRNSVIAGGLLGILYNSKEGPSRCKNVTRWIIMLACLHGYYACVKMLIFSGSDQFQAGPETNWFWALFVWCLIGSAVSVILWYLLSSYIPRSSTSIVIDAERICADTSEKEPLLAKHLFHGKCSSIHSEGLPSNVINNREHEFEHHLSSPNESLTKSCSVGADGDASSTSSTFSEKEEEKGFTELLDKATLKTMLSYTLPDWKLVLFGVIFLIGSSVAQIFLPLYTGKVVAGVVATKSTSQFTKDVLIMGLISFLASLFAGIRGGSFMNVIQRLNIRVRNALFKSLMSQEIGFYDKMKTGEITSRLTSDTTTMSDTVGLNCNIFLRSVIQAIGVCAFMFALSWRLSVVTFMGFPLVLAISEVYGKYYKKLQELVQDRFALANEVAEEVCSSMQTVRSFANEKGETERYNSKLMDVYKVQVKQALSYAGYIWCSQNIELLLTVVTLWYGGYLLVNGNLTAEQFISFILYQESLGECMTEMGEVYTGLMEALGAAEKVFQLIQRTPNISIEDGKETQNVTRGHLAFKNVNFSYPARPDQPVLQDVSFEVNPGEVVALVGPSGGGKSSCMKLLQRFYDPISGSVMLDGRPVNSYKHEFLHEKISLVGQEPVLYARSIRDNISYGPSDHDDQDVVKAAIASNAHDFIMELKDQYNTETGEKGTQLSGGQKQRIAIARALVRNPRVLLLDEATSALDTESEYLVQEALERSKSHRTVLLIAHRLSTVERADRIVVIVKGRVVEVGNHRQLMDREGMYYKLVHRQLRGFTKFIEPPNEGPVKKINRSPRDNFPACNLSTSLPNSLLLHYDKTSRKHLSTSPANSDLSYHALKFQV